MRCELPRLVEQLAQRPALRDIAMTTNGILLAEQAEALAQAGLKRVTVSLDTLDERVFERIARRPGLPNVLAGIEAATRLWPGRVKLDTVVLRDVNDTEVPGLLEFARERGIEARFIEYMDVGGATHWSPGTVVSRDEILRGIARRHGRIEELASGSSAPAERFRLHDGTVFGIVASTTAPFCARCDRSRLTADGHWYLCLYARLGLDLRALLRAGASTESLAQRIALAWSGRRERGAEDRLAERERGPFADSSTLREDPRLEMHTRGG
jgi:cyclic pyranopterin phosphate synthase